jgi:hypothetical protein
VPANEADSVEFVPRLRRAYHADEAYEADIAECRKIINEHDGLHYVAHVTSGVFDFALDAPWRRPQAEFRSADFDRGSRHLSLVAAQWDAVCQTLDSGILLRVVMQGNNGSLFHVLKLAGQTFFGLTANGAAGTVERADKQMARLADAAVRRAGTVSLNWGGFRSRENSGELRKSYAPAGTAEPARAPHTEVGADAPAIAESVTAACRLALDRSHLHFVGIYQHGQLVWCADIFDDPDLAPLFQRVTPAHRRHGYHSLVAHVHMQVRRIGNLLQLADSDTLVRLVLDAARGAIYILPMNEDHYLVGVTLSSSQTTEADRRIKALRDGLVG